MSELQLTEYFNPAYLNYTDLIELLPVASSRGGFRRTKRLKSIKNRK
jgi:hypothetical protein